MVRGGLCGLIVAVASATPATAQDAGALAAHDNSQNTQDIIVTATRRPALISNLPLAISAFGAEALANGGASDVRQLSQLSSSLLISSTGSEANAVARIRGIGTVGDNPGLESSVGLFIDGVYRARTGVGLTELGEVDRIELLRGPQGTLFGRNSTAGLINIVTKAPEFRFGGSAAATYGNYDQWRLAARVTGPIAPHIAASLEGVRVTRNGFLDEVDKTGAIVGRTNDRDRYLLRGQLLIAPDAAFSLRLIGDYSRRDESCCGAVYFDTGEETGSSPQNATPSASNRIVTILEKLGQVFPNGPTPYVQDPYQRQISITPGRDYASRVRDWGLSAEANYTSDSGIRLTSITAYRDYKSADYGDYDYAAADLLYRDPNTYRQFRTLSQEARVQGKALSGKLDWLVGGYFAHEQLTLRDNIRFGADYGRFAACRLLAGTSAQSNLSAAQLGACASLGGTAQLIAGTQASLNTLLATRLPAQQAAQIAAGLGQGLTALAGIPSGTGDTDSRYRQTSESGAIFTHDIVHITDRLDLTLGLRYTRETKDFSAALNNNNATCAALQASNLPSLAGNIALGSAAALAGGILTLGCLGNGSTSLDALSLKDRTSDGDVSGTAILSWKASDGLLLYASYARGHKSGGYNLDRFELGNTGIAPNVSPVTYFAPRTNADVAALRFGAETVDSYEVGLKYSGRRMDVNIAAFREAFGNFQLNTFNGTSFIVQNINGCRSALTAAGTCDKVRPGLVSQGVEVEIAATPFHNLTMGGGVTYAATDFADRLVGSRDGSVPLDPALFLLPGSRASNAPRITATANIAWTPPLGSNGLSGLFYVDGRANGGYNRGSDLYPEKGQGSEIFVNARIGLRGRGQRWAIEFWAQNLFDTDSTQVIFNSPVQSSSPDNQSIAQLGRSNGAAATAVTNQIFSAFLSDPRTYGVTIKGTF